jgi:hypothetical protein
MSGEIANWAPIGLFIYKRPEHARRTIVSLLACDGFRFSPIHVFADGPKSDVDTPAVQATRAVAHDLLGGSATYVEHERNLGLANSIIAGTTALCDRYGTSIVVEDDLILAPYLIRFLNEGLERYRDEPRVMQISGHMFDVPALKEAREALLLPLTTSWGWATWKPAWDLFDPLAIGWREFLAGSAQKKRFNIGGQHDYFRLLKRQMRGELDSWAIRWYYSVFSRGGLVLFPPRTLVINRGLDASGTHDRLARPAHQGPVATVASFGLPTAVAESRYAAQVFEAIGAFRAASAPRRVGAYLDYVRRRVGLR